MQTRAGWSHHNSRSPPETILHRGAFVNRAQLHPKRTNRELHSLRRYSLHLPHGPGSGEARPADGLHVDDEALLDLELPAPVSEVAVVAAAASSPVEVHLQDGRDLGLPPPAAAASPGHLLEATLALTARAAMSEAVTRCWSLDSGRTK